MLRADKRHKKMGALFSQMSVENPLRIEHLAQREEDVVIRFIAFVLSSGFSILVAAQPFPAKPIEIVNAFAPGGALDLNVRALQVAAERVIGQPIVQMFKQGGGGVVGASEVATAAPDGYKLLVVSSGELTAAPNLVKTNYSIDSFAFLGRISSRPYGLIVNSKAPWKEFGAMLRATTGQPGKHTIGTTPAGGMFLTAQHFIKRIGRASCRERVYVLV